MSAAISITVGNLRRGFAILRKPGVYRVDRGTALGNPYFMKTEAQRDEACDKFEAYFPGALQTKPAVKAEFDRMVAAARQGPITIMCWCDPDRCHALTIKAAIKAEISAHP